MYAVGVHSMFRIHLVGRPLVVMIVAPTTAPRPPSHQPNEALANVSGPLFVFNARFATQGLLVNSIGEACSASDRQHPARAVAFGVASRGDLGLACQCVEKRRMGKGVVAWGGGKQCRGVVCRSLVLELCGDPKRCARCKAGVGIVARG